MKKLLVVGVSLVLLFAAYLTYTAVDSKAPSASAKHEEMKVYKGTLYVAGMGGHFASADVEIDPADAANPIKVKGLDRIVIGDKTTHPTHDPRIDANDPTKMYWSTYKLDPNKMLHVGVSDLKTGKVIKDVAVKADDRVKWSGAMYCASGQGKKTYLPVTMSNEAYIDVFDKADLSHKRRVFLDNEGYKDNYFFYHGINTPDMKKFVLSVNMTQKWEDPSKPGATTGEIDMVMLDMAALEAGKVKVLDKKRLTGDPKKTKTFRQAFTPDGNHLLQSGGDRFYLLDGKLGLKDEELMVDGAENHDAIPTPDGKYAVLTLRKSVRSTQDPEGKGVIDGMLLLYDIEAKKVVGDPVSVCYDCHKQIGIQGNATLCGLDGNWK